MKRKRIMITVFSLLFILIMCLVILDKLNFFDEAIYQFIISKRSTFLDHYFIFITKFGNYPFILFLIVILMLSFHNRYSWFIGFGSLGCISMNTIVKNIIKRSRPDTLRLIKQGGYSFPSGHAMISISLYGFLLYLVLTKIKNNYLKYILVVLLCILILSIGISRIYLGVHFASDVIAGYILSLIYVIILIEIDLNIHGGR